MRTRLDVIRFISYHITDGKGIKIDLDSNTLRLEMPKNRPYMIWHNETRNEVAAIIYEQNDAHLDCASPWAEEPAKVII